MARPSHVSANSPPPSRCKSSSRSSSCSSPSEPSPPSASASYAHDDATITKDTNVNLIGKRVVNVPRDTASFWSTNELQTGDLAGLKFGGGLLQTDNRLVNNANLFFLPSYVRYDAVVSYRLKSWRVALNIQNLTDKKYFDSAGGVFHPMAPRQFFLNLAYTF